MLQFSCSSLKHIKKNVIKNKIKVLEDLEITTFVVLYKRTPLNSHNYNNAHKHNIIEDLYETVKVGQTEVINSHINPKFKAFFEVEYLFQDNVMFTAKLYNVVENENLENLEKQHLVG